MKRGNYNSIFRIIKRHLWSTLPYLNITKVFNIVLAYAEMNLGKTIVSSKPYFIKIEPTSKCNLNCVGCLHALNRNELTEQGMIGDIDFDLFKKIIDDAKKYLVKVSLYSLGEPFLYKRIDDMIAYLNENNIGSVISSNLNYLPSSLAENIVKNKLTHLIVSLDGADSETYAKYRRGGSFGEVIKNIQLIQKIKKEQNSKYPIIEIQTIKLDHVSDEIIAKIKKIASELEADKFTVKPNVTPYYDNPQPRNGKCFWMYGNPQIKWDGSVQPCCHYYEYKENDFGNIKDNSLNNIWNNNKFRSARHFIKTGERPGEEIKCQSCIFYKPTK